MAARALRRFGIAAVLALGLVGQAAGADDVERSYAGRKLSVVIGHEVGTGFDLYGRVLARHMGRFIPGHPTLVPENMPGAAGFASANWLYNAAPKDGSAIAIFAHTAPFEPLIGKGSGRFDASKFAWIGNMDAVVGVCGVWEHAGISTFDELYTKETLFGASGAGSGGPLSQFPTALRRLLGVKIKLIQGYRGSAEVRLAMARGELQGICGIRFRRSRRSGATISAPGASRPCCSSGASEARSCRECRTSTTTARPRRTGRCSTSFSDCRRWAARLRRRRPRRMPGLPPCARRSWP